MADTPDIDDMAPDRWLSRMHRLRDELLSTIAAELDEHQSAEPAARSLETVFRQYELSDRVQSGKMLEAEANDGKLVLTCEKSDERVILERDGRNHWWYTDDQFPEADRRSIDELHAELAEEILQLVPWWTEDAFTEKAGRPGDFT